MWCIGVLTEEYRRRTHAMLELYARPLSRAGPVICIDEKSRQLLRHGREPLPRTEGAIAKHDYEYERNGTTNLFVVVEPKAGHRVVLVTEHRGKVDFVGELLTATYATARRVHLVLDNLNTHFRKCLDDVLGKRAGAKFLRRVEFHFTPKHASWLNMAEIEIGILSRHCLDRASTAGSSCATRSMHGSTRVTLSSEPSSGNSLGRMQIRSLAGRMFRNLRVDVLARDRA